MRSVTITLLAVAAFFSVPFAGPVVRLSPDTVVSLAASQSVMVKSSELTLEARKREVQAAVSGLLPVVSSSAGYTRLSKQPTFGGLGGGGMSMTDVARLMDVGGTLDPGDSLVLGLLDNAFAAFSQPMAMGPQSIINLGLTVTQPIFTGGKLLYSVRMAQHLHDAQVFTHERTITEARLAALRLYWGYVSLVKSREAFQEGEAWLQNLVNDLQKLYDNGMIIELDLLNSRVQLDNYRQGAIRLDNASRTMGEQLLLFLGLDPLLGIEIDTSRWAGHPGDYVPPMPDSVENWLVYRDDLRAFDLQFETVKDMRKLQLASYAPTLVGFASYSLTNQYTMEEDKLESNPAVGLSLNWTMFDWGAAWRKAQGANCRIRQTALVGNNLRTQVRLKYRELSRKVEESQAAMDISRQALENARKALDIARARYDAGETTNTELLSARSQLTQKTVECAQARVNAILALEEYRVAPAGGNGGGEAAGSQ